jgi:hypothetical protein
MIRAGRGPLCKNKKRLYHTVYDDFIFTASICKSHCATPMVEKQNEVQYIIRCGTYDTNDDVFVV